MIEHQSIILKVVSSNPSISLFVFFFSNRDKKLTRSDLNVQISNFKVPFNAADVFFL